MSLVEEIVTNGEVASVADLAEWSGFHKTANILYYLKVQGSSN